MPTPISKVSSEKQVPAVSAENTVGGVGVSGVSSEGRGVEGRSTKGVGVVGVSEDYRGIEGRSTNEHAILGRSTKGAGVAGISEDNRGVHGRSTNEHGVFGESTKGAGVAGFSRSYRGVHGRSEDGQGVWGTSVSNIGVAGVSDSGTGVRGVSAEGVGVSAKGGKLAGSFEGDVEVSGVLKVAGVPINVLIDRLQVAEQRIAVLERTGGGTSGRGGYSPSDVYITVQRGREDFTITGFNFLPNKPVRIRVADGYGAETSYNTTANAAGKFVFQQRIPCVSGLSLYFSATDGRAAPNLTGVLWSNTVEELCP